MPQLFRSDGVGAPNAIREEATPLDCRTGGQRLRQDGVPGAIDGYADAPRRAVTINGPWAAVHFASADNDDGLGYGLVSGKNAAHSGTLALGALSIQLSATAPASGIGNP
jgi:hypothetical protein